MNVTLSPIAPRYAVSDADDPFKKYWWAILLGIVFTAFWLLAPMLGENPIGSTAIDAGKPKADANVEQSLASDAGGAALSMDGTGHKKKEEGPVGSSLYQAPPEIPAAAATAVAAAVASASGATLADELKKVSQSAGGWSEKAQRGFSAPKLGGGSLSGMGAAGGGHSGSASGTNAFGSKNAKIGFADTKGLSGGGSDVAAGPNSRSMAALRAASAQALLAAADRSGDGAHSSLSRAFDGAKGGSNIGGAASGVNGVYAGLDAAPVNLKLDDPKLNEKKITPPPGVDHGASGMKDSDIAKQIAMQMIGVVIGAVIGGPVGGAVSQAAMQVIQQQADRAEKARQLDETSHENDRRRSMGLPVQQPS